MKSLLSAILLIITTNNTQATKPDIEIHNHKAAYVKAGSRYTLAPTIWIQANTDQTKKRPTITMTTLIRDRSSDELRNITLVWNWEKERWEPKQKRDPIRVSEQQPDLNYKTIHSKKLTNEKPIKYAETSLPKKAKILAIKTRLYIDGKLIDSHETRDKECTWKDWEAI